MITTKGELKECLKYEKELYTNTLLDYLTFDQRIYNWRYIKFLRKSEYYGYKKEKNLICLVLWFICRTRRNLLGAKIGIQIQENSFQKGLLIHHNGNIVVNGGARIGKDCQLHGDNCIGNSGKKDFDGSPSIGNNVDIGVGAKILGSITLADNIKVGAGAVVVHSFLEPGITIVGVPARKVK